MANFLLSGISAGANQGLANLVASKRADRMAARENRRYEQELMFRIGSAEQARQERERSFAYQQTRDKAADEQWAKAHGLQMDALTERKRSAMVSEQLGRDRLTQGQQQFDAELAQRGEQFDEQMQYNWEGLNQRQEQFDAEQGLRERGLAESITARQESNKLADERNQTLTNYYEAQIRIAEERLKQPLSEIERQKVQAEIDRLKAQTGLYEAQTGAVGVGEVPNVPIATGRNIAQEFANTYAGYFDDQGREFRPPFTSYGVGVGWGRIFNPVEWFSREKNFAWDSTDPQEPTQKRMLQTIGGDMFDRLVQTYGGNVQAAYQHLDTVLDGMLADERLGGKIYERIRRSLPTELSGDDDFLTIRNLARDQIRRGALLKHSELVSPAQNTTGTDTDPALNFR